jgi:hypothetical protein
VGIKNIARRLGASTAEIDRSRLQDRYTGLDRTPIGEAVMRKPLRVTGEVQALRVVPSSWCSCIEVTISDGTGKAVGVFTGRKKLRGVEPGRGVLLEGVGRHDHGRLVLLNPAYTILD